MTDQQATAPHDGATVRPELLEALTRLLATLTPPPQPAPSLAGEPADFLTTGQFAGRLGVSRETVRRLAVADVLPHAVVCRGARKTSSPVPAPVRRRFRRQRPGRGRPGRFRRPVARGHGRRAMSAALPVRDQAVALVLAGRGGVSRRRCRCVLPGAGGVG